MKIKWMLLFVIVAVSVQAQKSEIEIVRSVFRLEKKAVVADYLKLSDKESEQFWTIYDEYEKERMQVADQRLGLIDSYMSALQNGMSEDKANELVNTLFSVQKKESSLLKKYYSKVKRSVSVVVAARFVQIEEIIQIAVLNSLNEQMPLVERARK